MKKWQIGLGVAALVAIVLGIILLVPKGNTTERTYGQYDRNSIKELAEKMNFYGVDPDTVMKADSQTGGIGEKLRGASENGSTEGKLVVFEYADYACAHCADWHSKIEDLMEKHPGKIVIVFRDFLLNFQNSVIAASAANAAHLQGYWEPYASLLYANQNEWYSLSGRNLQTKLEDYLVVASDGKADVVKFRKDMKSEAVAKRLAFNLGLGELVGLEGTPLFRINGEKIELSDLITTIEEKLLH